MLVLIALRALLSRLFLPVLILMSLNLLLLTALILPLLLLPSLTAGPEERAAGEAEWQLSARAGVANVQLGSIDPRGRPRKASTADAIRPTSADRA